EIDRQIKLIEAGGRVAQETLGWDEAAGRTLPQRSKEEAHDYRYFPEPDLPPLIVDPAWVAEIRAGLPELPLARQARFQEAYDLNPYDAGVLVAEQAVAEYFEAAVAAAPHAPPKTVANWVSGELFGLLNEAGESITTAAVPPAELGALIEMVVGGEINQTTAKEVLTEMFAQGTPAAKIVAARGLKQISDRDYIAGLAASVLDENPEQTAAYLQGKETLGKWLFGQIMRKAQGRANPQVVQAELERALNARRA
ncbi:MAG TPA: Asp-tRNA(Asn)/Glu-tRNA(Gln) amidotransferase GatCAB subunit B, partial [Anaerolineales bacterium]|nr:Asp-tRNA(Asn)/Glu-tRNA(Gln) amidotransferase GatCAB subunit B [Anaerolineales bacterium]